MRPTIVRMVLLPNCWLQIHHRARLNGSSVVEDGTPAQRLSIGSILFLILVIWFVTGWTSLDGCLIAIHPVKKFFFFIHLHGIVILLRMTSCAFSRRNISIKVWQ
ncbi:uncharacterized protein BYT42DRAFT_556834 [Radiomyces spectabilis]|uniref:uncharacterized protein n=1 Tax=Radiomyces spectabilis TaxID=64574 RepID=UPI00221FEA68|nr:uncharacterized protein BYT42DRAFT_556834 [Radiomyces spectabilis]KAI8391430.1 hypothetical protein BYT42DRAFT_556834 [Radiomyces spectabilis]